MSPACICPQWAVGIVVPLLIGGLAAGLVAIGIPYGGAFIRAVYFSDDSTSNFHQGSYTAFDCYDGTCFGASCCGAANHAVGAPSITPAPPQTELLSLQVADSNRNYPAVEATTSPVHATVVHATIIKSEVSSCPSWLQNPVVVSAAVVSNPSF